MKPIENVSDDEKIDEQPCGAIESKVGFNRR